MSIPPREAADTLHDIEHTQHYSAAAYGYQKAAPHLFLWGLIWVVGYGVTYVRPRSTLIWAVLMVVGIGGSFFMGWRTGASRSGASVGWRFFATFIAIFLFLSALLAVVPPRSAAQVDAVIPLVVGLWYVIMGVWLRATRIAVLGLALGILTVGGYFSLPQYFLLWMAGVGGGALILGGLWLRRV